MRTPALAALGLTALVAALPAQTCSLVKDIYSGTGSGMSWNEVRTMTSVEGRALYFAATDGSNTGFWKAANGVASLVKGIAPTTGFVTAFDGKKSFTVFGASDSTSGEELWITDGTGTGTKLLKDINPGAGGSSPHLRSWRTAELGIAHQGRVYFTADDGTHGRELWVTDGTANGTLMLKDTVPGSASGLIASITGHKRKVYFSAYDSTHGRELWITDGTPGGTKLLKDTVPGSASGLSNAASTHFVLFRDELFFGTDASGVKGLWKSDGTANGTVQVKALGYLEPMGLIDCGDKIAFGTSGDLWVSDGTSNGTVRVKDFSTADLDSGSIWIDGALYFSAFTYPWDAAQLWKSDLTTNGTVLLKNFPNRLTRDFTPAGGKVFFTTQIGHFSNDVLHSTDGTASGTIPLATVSTGFKLVPSGNGVHFAGRESATGTELWFSDGTQAGTRRVSDIAPGSGSSSPTGGVVCDGVLYFAATDPKTGTELWRLDAKPGTTEVLGESCGKVSATLRSTDPVIGQKMSLHGDNATTAAGVLALGVPSSSPISLFPVLQSGCGLYISPATVQLFPQPAGKTWSMSFTMPNDPSLRGVQSCAQSVYGAAPMSISNALKHTIGG